MKKSTKTILAGLALGIVALLPSGAKAQRVGEMSLGIHGGVATYNSGGYIKADFQYTILQHLRLTPDFGYVFRNEGKSAFFFDVDLQLPFRVAKGLTIYPLVGFTFNNWSFGGDHHASRAGANFGAGFDVYLTSNLKLNLQGKYSLMNDTGGGFFDAGIAYVF